MWLGRQADDLFVCFGAKPKRRAWTRDLRRYRKWRRKGRFERRQTAEETSWREIVDQGTDGQQKEAVREDIQKWVGIFSSFVKVSRKIHAYDSLQMHEKLHKIVTKLPFLRLELTQVHIVRLFFFFHSLSCIFFCGRKEMWNTSAKPTGWITGHE